MNTDWLKQRAGISPKHPALIFEDQVWTYASLDGWVNRLCQALQTAGLDNDGVVAVLLPNTPLHIAIIHALARLGIPQLALNNRLTTAEMQWQLDDVQVRWLLFVDDSTTTIDSIACAGKINLNTLDLPTEAMPRNSFENKNELQGIFYTSGTTGKPKGVALTFANYQHSAMASAYRLGLIEEDRWLLTLPLYHIGGQSIVFRACLYGISIVLQDGFDATNMYQAIVEEDVTLISVVPTMLHRLMPIFKTQGLPKTLRVILVGGAQAPQTLIEEALALDLPIALTYGLTEATSQVATAPPHLVRSKPGTVGKPLFGTELEIIDESGNSLMPHEIGEIVVRGPTVMQGYYVNPAATAKTLQGGNLLTGDLGYLDEDGDLWLVSRRADLIVSGGENVYPAEVETVLLKYPGVQEACVVGLKDPEWGQIVAAAIVADEDVTEQILIEFSRQHLAGYKTPRQVYSFDAFPKTASGKIMRRAVLEQIAQTTIIRK